MQVPPGRAGQMSAPSTSLQAAAPEKRTVALIHGRTFRHTQIPDRSPACRRGRRLREQSARSWLLARVWGHFSRVWIQEGTGSRTRMVAFIPEQAYRHV